MCTPEQQVAATESLPEITFHGIRLIKNPFIPDGEIYPFEKWGLRPKKFSLPVEPL
jgi:hypothetical protein